MIANLNKAMFTKLINGSLVQVQLGEPKSLENQGFFHYQRFYDIRK